MVTLSFLHFLSYVRDLSGKDFCHGNKHKRICAPPSASPLQRHFLRENAKLCHFSCLDSVRGYDRECFLYKHVTLGVYNSDTLSLSFFFFFCQLQKHTSKFTGLTLCSTHDQKLCLRIIKSLLSQMCNAFPSTRRLILSLIRLLDYISAAIRYELTSWTALDDKV